MTPDTLRRFSHEDQWFRYWMPYAFVPLAHHKLKYVLLPLNRNYKPLGITSKDHVKYVDYLSQAMIFKTDPALIANVWHNTQPHLYLYDDAAKSRTDYFPRLQKLLSRSVRLVGKLDDAPLI